MTTKKSPGIDKTPIGAIKDCLPAILPSITSIINATFLSAQFPNVWKIAEVTPILKDGDRDIPNNYRPISLLPVCALKGLRESRPRSANVLFNSKPTSVTQAVR